MKSTVVSVESKAKVPIRIQRQVLSLGSLLSYVLFHQTGLEGGWFAMNLGSESLALKYAKAGLHLREPEHSPHSAFVPSALSPLR